MGKIEFKDYQKKWRQNNIEHCREYSRKWAKDNPEKIRKYAWDHNNNPKRKMYRKEHHVKNKIRDQMNSKIYFLRLKQEILNSYGNICECCGESESRFLTLDHINRNGKEHRKRVGSNVYHDLKRRGFPQEGYRTLCMNCNFAIRHGEECPHKLSVNYILGLVA